MGDLKSIKGHIDIYDRVYSGFANDLEDIQEVIFLLTNYGGTDLKEFLADIKKYKTVKLDSAGTGDNSGLSTMTIDIPIEAREKLLELTRRAIFEQGQGVDPNPESFGTASGVALKYLYALLEQKTGRMETKFRLGFAELIRVICDHLSIKAERIIQTWTRTAIQNEQEIAQICKDSVGIISQETVLKNHPYVEDVTDELAKIAKENEVTDAEYLADDRRKE